MHADYTIITPRLRLEALALGEVRALAASATSLATSLAAERATVAARLRAALPPEWPGPGLTLALPVIAEEMAAEPGDARWVWAVIAPGSDAPAEDGARVIGDVGFHGALRAGASAEIGYVLAPETRGRGYATEACAALLAWVWGQTGVAEVTAQIEPSNAASLRVAAKLAMRPLPPEAPGYLRFGVERPSSGRRGSAGGPSGRVAPC